METEKNDARDILRIVFMIGFSTILIALAVIADVNLYNIVADKGEETHRIVNICINSIGLTVLVVLLSMTIFELQYKSIVTRLYAGLVFTTTLGLFSEIVTLLLEGDESKSTILFWITVLNLILGEIQASILCFYLTAFYNANHTDKTSYLYSNLALAFNGLCVICTVAFSIAGKAFTIENGVFVRGEFYDFVGVGAEITIVAVLIYVCSHAKALGVHDAMAIIIYLLMALLGALVENNFGLIVSYVGAALSNVMAYVVLQSREMNKAAFREQLLLEASTGDSLTGLKNRRAYEEVLKEVESSPHCGVIFTDMNGLKYVNDNYGHSSGDQYLCKYAGILKNHFRTEDTFRISGDEFVILMPIEDENRFRDYARRLEKDVEQNDCLASIGVSYGEGNKILSLIKDAERDMYSNKKDYYERSGKDRRQF